MHNKPGDAASLSSSEDCFGQVIERLSPGVTAGYFSRVGDTVVPNIRRLQEGFRARGMAIFFTRTETHTGDGPPRLAA